MFLKDLNGDIVFRSNALILSKALKEIISICIDLKYLNLRKGCVSNLNIKGINFHGSCFWGTSLKNIKFSNCDLSNIDFRTAVLTGCCFENCDLSKANFLGSHFENCRFIGCMMRGVEFSHSSILFQDFQNIKQPHQMVYWHHGEKSYNLYPLLKARTDKSAKHLAKNPYLKEPLKVQNSQNANNTSHFL